MTLLRSAVDGATVLAVAVDDSALRRIRAVLPRDIDLATADSVVAAIAIAKRSHAPALVYRLTSPAGQRSDALCHASPPVHEHLHVALRGALRSLSAVALCASSLVDVRAVAQLRELPGVRLVVEDAPDGDRALWLALESALSSGVQAEIRREIGDVEPPLLRSVLFAALRVAFSEVSLDMVARGVGLHERTLRRRLQSTGGPPPQWIVGWARLFVALWHLRRRAVSVSSVADALGFSAAPNLHRLAKEYTGRSLASLREGDPLRDAIECFRHTRGMPARFAKPDQIRHAGGEVSVAAS